MIFRLVLRHLALRPVRSAVFVGAYAAGVAVMLALLSIGEVMVEQARDEQWVGGGDITVLPAGVDLETLKLGGAIFYGIRGSRFVAREVLGGPRLAGSVEAVAPWIEDRVIYLRSSGVTTPVRASGQIPSAAKALGAAPDLVMGRWEDSPADRLWLRPEGRQLFSEIDRFHHPPERLRGDSTWAEWHYFNLLWPAEDRWLYLSFIIGGDVTGERWAGQLLARYHAAGQDLIFMDTIAPGSIQYSETSAELDLGSNTVRLLADPVRYAIKALIPPVAGARTAIEIDLEVIPSAHRYFPPTEIASSDSLVSGYVVPALRAEAKGVLCIEGECLSVAGAIAYHDHNWGTWSGIAWDWGIAHAGGLDWLYGGVHGAAADAARQRDLPFLVYIVDSLGVAAVLELRQLEYAGARPFPVPGGSIDIPETLTWTATQGSDSVTARIQLLEISLTQLGLGADTKYHFAQMYGRLDLQGIIGGRSIAVQGPGFFETYILGAE